ncbi:MULTISPECIES: phage baseplate protein [unclassified Clostridium]|uniref:phage baseplate protein n=1 Tax=unclassified Clostridium TaxID=2614128 RepID=UPI000297FA17|nr:MULTISPECIES: hypothetical protein [unclassified Clostridium]EKQ56265.1 MAG: hypothetical protein A370_02021 [Clostridium sp. Maddingley MBC34-26]
MAQEVVKTYLETSQGNYMFDAYFNITHNSELEVTEHPVQTSANVSDHAFMQPLELTFEVGMSDVMSDVTNSNYESFSSDTTRSINAYKKLRELQSNRIPINVVTKLWIYNNMMIKTLSAVDSNTTAYGLRATVTLKEILVATVTTVKISERPQKSEETNEGDQKVQKVDESLLSEAFN